MLLVCSVLLWKKEEGSTCRPQVVIAFQFWRFISLYFVLCGFYNHIDPDSVFLGRYCKFPKGPGGGTMRLMGPICYILQDSVLGFARHK